MDAKAVELRRKVLAALGDRTLDDRALLRALEALATDRLFAGFSHLFGPALYERNPSFFLPFLHAHCNAFGGFGYYDEQGKPFDPWKRDLTREPLERMLEQVERDGDVQLFRKLYAEHTGSPWRAPERWRGDVRKKFLAARSDPERRKALEMFDLAGAVLDEDAAYAIYEAAPSLTTEFLLAHSPRELPYQWAAKIAPWKKLRALASKRGDHDLEQKLFRLQATADEWAERARSLGRSGGTTEQLDAIHPEWTPKNAAEVYRALLEMRGEEVLPYVMRHLDLRRGFWSQQPIGSDKLIALAEQRGWLQLWAALLRNSSEGTYNEAVLNLIEDRAGLSESGTRDRLLLLAGVGRELNFPGFGIARVMPLSDASALALYRRFPDLLRTVFRGHATPGFARTHAPLARAAIEGRDEELIDWLASRAVTLNAYKWGQPSRDQLQVAELLSRYYEELLGDSREFARRAGNVLSAIPANAIFSYDALIKNNRLARLLFERSHEDYLADPVVVRDLLESPQIFVNRLAYQILSVDSPRAREAGAQNLDLLCAALLRKLHRQTRVFAMDALTNAASSEAAARVVLPRARDALRLPDKRYPKEKLIGMIGAILSKHPSLRGEREQPKVFEVRT